MKPCLCIYHANCADGFASAWVVRRKYGEDNVDFHPGVYQDPPPLEACKDRDVLIVDFSYKSGVLRQIGDVANTVTVLDHHKTAAEDLHMFRQSEFPGRLDELAMPFHEFRHFAEYSSITPVRALFDMERSGAGITWDWCFPGEPRPDLINHIEDRDLWRFRLPGTREIQANVFSWPYDFKVWDRLFSLPVEELRKDGEAIERKHFKDVCELVEVMKRPVCIGGMTVPGASIPYTMTSDAGHIMCLGNGTDEKPEFPFAVCYWDTPEGRIYSLRSATGGVDVSEIAKRYGGGGHAHAAGFQVPFDRIGEFG